MHRGQAASRKKEVTQSARMFMLLAPIVISGESVIKTQVSGMLKTVSNAAFFLSFRHEFFLTLKSIYHLSVSTLHAVSTAGV
jgi:hypothetical protein